MSSTLLLPPRAQLCNRSCSSKTHTHSPVQKFLVLSPHKPAACAPVGPLRATSQRALAPAVRQAVRDPALGATHVSSVCSSGTPAHVVNMHLARVLLRIGSSPLLYIDVYDKHICVCDKQCLLLREPFAQCLNPQCTLFRDPCDRLSISCPKCVLLRDPCARLSIS